MARQIIVLDTSKTSGSDFTVTAVFWLAAPANRVVPKPTFSSAVPPASAASWGIAAQELTALQAGTVVEQVVTAGQFPAATTPAAVRTALEGLYTAAQTALTNQGAAAKFIGASFDGTSWTAAP